MFGAVVNLSEGESIIKEEHTPYNMEETVLDSPPVETAYAIEMRPMFGMSPVQSVAELQLKLFQQENELFSYESSAMTRYRVFQDIDIADLEAQDIETDAPKPKPTETQDLVTTGDGELKFVSPTTDASADRRASIEAIKLEIDEKLDAIFPVLDVPSGDPTATESIIREIESTTELMTSVRELEDFAVRLYDKAYKLMGKELPKDFKVIISRKFSNLTKVKSQKEDPNG